MNYRYIVVSDGHPQCVLVKGEIPLEDLKKHVGTPGESAWIEVVYRQFSDLSIIIIVDEEGVLKGQKISCITQHGSLHGDFIIAAIRRNSDGERDIWGLTDEQVELVERQLITKVSVINPGL